MTVVKERNVIRHQHVTLSHKSTIQAEDLLGVKYHFDLCGSEASDETKDEYEATIQEQKDLQSLKKSWT